MKAVLKFTLIICALGISLYDMGLAKAATLKSASERPSLRPTPPTFDKPVHIVATPSLLQSLSMSAFHLPDIIGDNKGTLQPLRKKAQPLRRPNNISLTGSDKSSLAQLKTYMSTHTQQQDFWSAMESSDPQLFQTTKKLISRARSKRQENSYREATHVLDSAFNSSDYDWRNTGPYSQEQGRTRVKVEAAPKAIPKESQDKKTDRSPLVTVSYQPVQKPSRKSFRFPVCTSVEAVLMQARSYFSEHFMDQDDSVNIFEVEDKPDIEGLSDDDWDHLAVFSDILLGRPAPNVHALVALKQWLKQRLANREVSFKNKGDIYIQFCLQHLTLKIKDENILSRGYASFYWQNPLTEMQLFLHKHPGITLPELVKHQLGGRIYHRLEDVIAETDNIEDFSQTFLAEDLDIVTHNASFSWRDFVFDIGSDIDEEDGERVQYVYW